MSNGSDAPTTDELTARIDRLEHELAKLRSERETVLTGWPNEPTIAQGFMSGRWQRRDGDGYTQALVNIPEAPYDQNYYGRYQYTWQPVVEEAPAATSRRSTYGWARASAGSDITWISLDDILANFQPAGNYAPAGDYLDKSGGQMTGPLIARDGGSATNPGLAIGENSTGFWRTSGNLLVTSVGGVVVMQIQPAIGAFFVPLNFTNQRLQAVGDATAPDDALNLRTGDTRYIQAGASGFLPISGGTLTGPLITAPGTGVRDLAIGVGDDLTGLYRQGNSLAFMAQGFPLMLLDGDSRSILTTGPLSMGGSAVTNLGNATLPTDAVTKGYVDNLNLRAKPIIYDIPADVVIPASGDWTNVANVPCTLPARPGVTSLLMVCVNCNLRGVNNVNGIGVRVPISPTPEQRVFGFGPNATDNSAGFSVNIFVSPAPGVTTFNIAVQLNAFNIGATVGSYTVVGGNVLVLDRSQVVIIDLGPL